MPPSSRSVASVVAVSAAVLGGCVSPGTLPGMAPESPRPHAEDPSLVELSRAEGREDTRALLVVYPRAACSGSAATVFVDEERRFLGAIGPGTAALLEVPRRAGVVFAISSVELTAARGTSSMMDRVSVPPAPSGIRLASYRGVAGRCGSGQYTDAVVATKAELEELLAESEIRWLTPRRAEGQAWLDERRARLDEVLTQDDAWRARVALHRQLWGTVPP